jgi:hypothetical protein
MAPPPQSYDPEDRRVAPLLAMTRSLQKDRAGARLGPKHAKPGSAIDFPRSALHKPRLTARKRLQIIFPDCRSIQ